MLTAEQKKKRLEGIGGSEIGSLAGVNPYAGPLDVWRAKVEGYEIPVTAPMERGNFLEAGIAAWYGHRTGAKLLECETLKHPSFPLVMCTPDRIAIHPDGELDLSIKSPGPWTQGQWGEPGTDQIPMSYLLQVQWELIVLEGHRDIRRAHVAAPIGNDLHIYNVLADAELQGRLIEIAQKFWRDHVETRTPPPVDGSESCSEWLRARYPSATASMAEATPEANELMSRLFALRAEGKKNELEQELIQNRLIELVGFHEGMTGPGWKLSFKNTKGSVKTDWKAVVAELSPPKEVIEKHSNTTNGSRRFLPTWTEKK